MILGSFIIIFDLKTSNEFIEENRNMTLLLILFEILISLFVSYYTGNKLTRMLDILTNKAKEIGEGGDPEIPYLNKNDEIGTLAKAMNKMKLDLETRRNNVLNIQKQKDNFFANMSHELKTPLNSINIISKLMLKNKSGNLDDNELRNIKIINSCGKDLLTLINDILDVSRLESGQVKISPSKFDFNKLFDEIVDMFLLATNEKGLEFIYEKDENLNFIYNDEVRIKQIIVNLIGNSIKFTQNGKITLCVYLSGEKINISVKDDGIGIPKDKQKLIFERFKQVDDGISRKYGGTGLGLAICKDLARLLGGNINVKSELGLGSEFVVTIDKNLDESSFNKVIEKDSLKNDELNQDIKCEKKYNILLLNDDVISFMKYTIELKREANSLVQVDEITQFIKNLTKNKFDVIIINIENFSQFIIHDSLRGIEFKKLYLLSKSDIKIDKNLLDLSSEVFIMPINKEEFISKVTS
jgi:signal transduction histidine kinase